MAEILLDTNKELLARGAPFVGPLGGWEGKAPLIKLNGGSLGRGGGGALRRGAFCFVEAVCESKFFKGSGSLGADFSSSSIIPNLCFRGGGGGGGGWMGLRMEQETLKLLLPTSILFQQKCIFFWNNTFVATKRQTAPKTICVESGYIFVSALFSRFTISRAVDWWCEL